MKILLEKMKKFKKNIKNMSRKLRKKKVSGYYYDGEKLITLYEEKR